MAFVENLALRAANAVTFQDETNPLNKRLVSSISPLHYQDANGDYQRIDMSPTRINPGDWARYPAFDGWLVSRNGWLYGLGVDGWVYFGGRRGEHYVRFRLAAGGYYDTVAKQWHAIAATPTYSTANLTRNTVTQTIEGVAYHTKTVAEWRNLFTTPGGGEVWLRFIVTGGRLKSEYVMNQVARAWITANRPPAFYGITPANAQFGFRFEMDWSDIPVKRVAGALVDTEFDDSAGGIELRNALDELLAFMPVDSIYVEQTDLPFRAALPQRKRFVGDALYMGAPVTQIAALPAGDLIFDPTITPSVAASGDDWTWINGTGWGNTETGLIVGYYVSTYLSHSSQRFLNITVPNGATINSAYVTYVAAASYTNTMSALTVAFYDADDAAAATSEATAEAQTQTTANTSWTPGNHTAGTTYDTPSLVSSLQEVIDRAGWASGNDVALVIKAVTASNNYRSLAAQDHATYAAALLTADYTDVPLEGTGGGQLTFSVSAAGTVASTAIEGTGGGQLTFGIKARGDSGAAITTIIDNAGTNALKVGDDTTGDWRVAQSFTPPATGHLTEFTIYLGTLGGATDIDWALCADNSGIPGTELLTGAFTPTGSANNTITVTGSPVLLNGTTYWIKLELPISTAYDQVYSGIDDPFAPGQAKWDYTTTGTFPDTWDFLANAITDLRMTFTVELLPIEGAGGGQLTFGVSAAGTVGAAPIEGTGGGQLTFSVASAGTVDIQGTGGGQLTFSVASAGMVEIQGAGGGQLTFSVASAGMVEIQGAGGGQLTFSVASAGQVEIQGAGGGQLTFGVSAVATSPIEGTGGGQLTFSVASSGLTGDTGDPYATWGFFVDWDGDGDFSESYEEITSYVRQATWRLGMRRMFQSLADKTECQLLVKNHDGRFSPENGASPYAGEFLPGRLMEIRTTFGGTTRTMWRGFLESVQPFGATKRQPDAEIKGTDLKGFAQKKDVSVELMENVTGDEALRRLFQGVQPPPGAWSGNWLLGVAGFSELGETTALGDPDDFFDFETGVVTHPYVGDRWSDGVDVYRAALDIAAAERGRLFTARDGKLTFWNWQHIALDYTSSATIDNTMIDDTYAYGQDIVNVIKVVTTPRKISANDDDVLWTQEESSTVKPGETKKINATFKDDSGADIAGKNIITPSGGAGTLAYTGAISLVVHEKARGAEIVITNNGTTDAEISTLILKGKKISSFDKREIVERDEDSAGIHGEIEETLPTELLSSEFHAKTIARYEIGRRKDPRGIMYSVTLQNVDAIIYDLMLSLTIGSRINVIEDVLYHDADYAIIGEEHRLTDAMRKHVTTWNLEIADAVPIWLLGIAGYSELGETTSLGW